MQLNIVTNFVHHKGVEGHTNSNKSGQTFINFTADEFVFFSRTQMYFGQLSLDKKQKLLDMYKIDFELFDYDWRKYF